VVCSVLSGQHASHMKLYAPKGVYKGHAMKGVRSYSIPARTLDLHHGLSLDRQFCDNRSDLRLEAHIQHAVSLVQN
jgi:hypothetical protein